MNIYLKYNGAVIGTFPLARTDEKFVMREVHRLQRKHREFEVDYSEFESLWQGDELARYKNDREVYGDW